MISEVIECKVGAGGVLLPVNSGEAIKHERFVQQFKEGDKVQVIYTYGEDPTYGWISRLHAIIRLVANETGNDFDTVKIAVKQRAGLLIENDPKTGKPKYKSFGICTLDEIKCATAEAGNMGMELGIVS